MAEAKIKEYVQIVAPVEEQIAALPALDELTAEDKELVEAARDAYEALSDNAKTFVTQLEVLTKAEQKISDLTTVVYGDINGDGSINASDALLALQHSVQLTTLEGDQAKAADVNKDEAINASDALIILQYSVRLVNQLPVIA